VTSLLIDTGPLVALLDGRDRFHSWTRDYFKTVTPPIFTCEPVLTECCFLLSRLRGEQAALQLITAGVLRISFDLLAEIEFVRGLMQRFADVPMSLADACLVRMTELERDSAVVTFDSDFRVYRRNRRQLIPTIMPPESREGRP
jgi:predicted nucleic acid-binding protein